MYVLCVVRVYAKHGENRKGKSIILEYWRDSTDFASCYVTSKAHLILIRVAGSQNYLNTAILLKNNNFATRKMQNYLNPFQVQNRSNQKKGTRCYTARRRDSRRIKII